MSLAFLVFALMLGSSLSAQTTFATITGTITDSTGAVIPAVEITARHVATGSESATRSNESGIYTIAQLKEGEYTLRARNVGFKEFVTQNVVLVARDYRRLDITLEVGAVETSVEVTAGATLVESETARISETKTADELKAIPLNTRAMWAFLALAPNVLQASGGSSTTRFAGSRSNQSHWAIDGTTMSDGVDESAMGPLANYIESFQEIKLDVSNNSAEFGSIGQVTVISKSGTNRLQGSVFDYYATPWFRAANPFSNVRPSGVLHNPGASVGGPLYLPGIYDGKDKSFFFFSFETTRGSAVNQFLNPSVPLEKWRGGDFSGLPAIRDPNTGVPFPNNRIPADRISATSQKIQDRFYPLPNFGDPTVFAAQNYRETVTRPRDPTTYWTARGDHRFSSRDWIYGRFTFQRGFTRPYEGNLPTIGQRDQSRENRAVSFSYTHTFSPTVLNEFRYGMAFNNILVNGPQNGNEVVQYLGLVGLAPDLPDVSGIFKVGFTGLGLTGISQADYTNPGYRNFLHEFQDHVSWFRGRHNLKAGFNLTRVDFDSGNADPSLFGSSMFSNRFTGHPYADFLLGIPSTVSRAFPYVVINRERWQYDLFLVDDIKLTPKLTANLGLRYEYHPAWTETNGRGSFFDIGTGKIAVQDGALGVVSPLMPKGYVSVVEAGSLGLPGNTIIRSDRNNILPRIGMAYRPWGENTVFRSGFGLFYDVVPQFITHGEVPFVINEPAYTNPSQSPDVIFPRVFPATSTGGPAVVSLPSAVNPDSRMPYSYQWNVTIEHSRWNTGFRMSYIGTNTRQGEWAYNYNSPVPDARVYVDKPRPFPNYPNISYFTNGAGHQYHGFTAEVERRMAKGLMFQASWTWARDIGDLERGASSENPFDRQRERAVWQDIPTHRFTSNWIYELPFGKGRTVLGGASRGLDLVVGGWELNGVYSYYSGQFLTPIWSGPDPVGIAYTSNRTPALVTIRPDILRDGNLPSDQRTVDRWFDVSAFAGPPVGRFGTSAKGVLFGPNVNVWHLGMAKHFVFTEHVRLRWELSATNAFNHPNYNNPILNITQTATVGTIRNVGGVNGGSTGDQPGPRQFRMGFRLEF